MDILKGIYKEFDWFIWGLVGLAFIWYLTGGTNSPDAHGGAYLKPPAPLDSGEAYGKYYAGSDGYGKTELDLPDYPSIFLRNASSDLSTFFISTKPVPKTPVASSLFAKNLAFDGTAGPKKDVDEEYVRVIASEKAKAPISISGFTLAGDSLDSSVAIPKAVNSLVLGTTGAKTDIVLAPGGRALISSERSPIGTSFRANMCTGYLDQFQTYTPALRDDCPEPAEELAHVGLDSDQTCKDFVEKLPRCRIYQGTYPSNISASCKAFIVNKLNYNACAIDHRNDANYLKDEWRVFLDQPKELWDDKSDIIRLLDDKGKTVDSLIY
ncbi:MAG TPA: hypothetical protein VGE35_02835 [Candidatus Paceibacterota bacterium]